MVPIKLITLLQICAENNYNVFVHCAKQSLFNSLKLQKCRKSGRDIIPDIA